jgi:hypothetical protein
VLALYPGVAWANTGKTDAEHRWVAQHDSRSGSTLHYRSPSNADVIRFDCVGPSLAMPLMDMTRPFNRILSIKSDMADDWLAGREVFAMVMGMDGWRKVDVLAVQDRLIIGPKETERGVIYMQITGSMKLKIFANAQSGVVEQDVEVPYAGMVALEKEQIKGCRSHFEK